LGKSRDLREVKRALWSGESEAGREGGEHFEVWDRGAKAVVKGGESARRNDQSEDGGHGYEG